MSVPDLATALGGAFIRFGCTWRPVVLNDWAEAAEHMAALQRGMQLEVLKNMKELGLKDGQLLTASRELSKPPTYSEVWRWLMSPAGLIWVLERCRVEGEGRLSELAPAKDLLSFATLLVDNSPPTQDEEDGKVHDPLAVTGTGETGSKTSPKSEGSTDSTPES